MTAAGIGLRLCIHTDIFVPYLLTAYCVHHGNVQTHQIIPKGGTRCTQCVFECAVQYDIDAKGSLM